MKHLFFDLDHTLWDFEKNSEAALRLLYANLELDNELRSFQSFHTAYKKVNRKLWNQYGLGQLSKADLRFERFNKTLLKFDVNHPELAEKLASGYVETSPHQTILFPNAENTLIQLRDLGYEMHIITNGFKEIQDIKLTKSGIRDYFDVVVCSEEVGKNKPAREVFTEALIRADAKAKDSVMIGDNYKADVLGAERSGICGVLFDPHREHREGSHEWHINDLDEIPELLPWIKQKRQ
ncbi:MAG: YjjG family noncanonical pyrimidine nucleotidase [Crocinitomicaceae bacterium]|nr:YjjG family noncanonical pyrimidine nucleotidase [Crocinitomicaceae bacterium]